MTSTTVDRVTRRGSGSAHDRQSSQRERSATRSVQAPTPDATSDETFSPARAALPWTLMLLVLSAVVVAYAAILGASDYLTGALVLVATVLGAVTGLAVRGARDRGVSPGRALGDGLRRLGHKLWS